jgi:protein-disulfide isomerase
MGPSTAHVTITEFGDFQCPFCAQTARDLESIREKFGDQVAIVFRHYPLRRHEHARRAAEIAECAAIQVPFERVYTVLYAEQDSLGTQLAPWFAAQMGVANVTAFSSCMTKHEGLVAVQRDIEAATALGVNSTPTILVNDQRITVAPRGELIESLVDSLLHAASGEVGSKDRRRSSGEDAK